jgi:hypothetical protein
LIVLEMSEFDARDHPAERRALQLDQTVIYRAH